MGTRICEGTEQIWNILYGGGGAIRLLLMVLNSFKTIWEYEIVLNKFNAIDIIL